MYCPNCSTKIKDEKVSCPNCGMSIAATAMDVRAYNESNGGMFFQKKNFSRIIVSFVSGIVSLVLFFAGFITGIFQVLGLAVALIGIFYNRRYNKGVQSKLRTAGFILNVIGVIIDGLFTILYLLMLIMVLFLF